MLNAIKQKLFYHDHEGDLQKIKEISENAKRFEQAVIESMSESFEEAGLRTSYIEEEICTK